MRTLTRVAMLTVILVIIISSVGCQVPQQVEPPVLDEEKDEEKKDTSTELETMQLDLTSLQIGHEAAMYEARIRSEEMQDGGLGLYGPHPGSAIPKGVYLILCDPPWDPVLRVSMALYDDPRIAKYIREGRYRVAIVTRWGEMRFTTREYEYVKSLPTTVVDDEHIYDLDKIREDFHFIRVYGMLNPGFIELSDNRNRTLNEETGEYEPDLIKAVAQAMRGELYGISFWNLEIVWGITEEDYNKAVTLNKLLDLDAIDEEGTISTEGVEIALGAGIEKTALINLGVSQSFIDLAISSTD